MHTLPNLLQLLKSGSPALPAFRHWLGLCIWVWACTLGIAHAQPAVGSIQKDYLALGEGRSVPLPPGQWQMTRKASIPRRGFEWEAMVFRNMDANAVFPFIVVRHSPTAVKWGHTPCTADASSRTHFLLSHHGTLPNGLINKCSRLFQIDNISSWLNSPSTKVDWWSDLVAGFSELGSLQNKSVLLAELRVQQYGSRGVDVDLFIVPPKGAGTEKFREDARSGQLSPDHEILDKWVSFFVESVEQSFLNKKPAPLLALKYQNGEARELTVASSAPNTPPNTLPNTPAAASKPVAIAQVTPPVAPTVAPKVDPDASSAQSQSQQNKERQAMELEKQNLAKQLEQMREMLAQLQKSNALAAEQASKSQNAAAPTSQPKTVTTFANRKALVIGNDLYTDVPKLKNAGTDADAMARTLQSVGYKVWKHQNLDEKRFKQALREFRQQIEGGDEVLVFYAGHGVQLGNTNYLLPTDIKGDHEDQIKDDAIQLQRLLDDMQDKKAKFALAVIDACRDNPFKGQGRAIGGRGLAPTTAATGQMIIFSAGSGQQALDKLDNSDTDRNGLFTRVFIKEMVKPGISVDRVLRNVRNEVVKLAKSVGHEQTPALYDQAVGEFYFRQ